MTVVERKKELKSKAICVLTCFLIQLTWIVPVGIKVHMDNVALADSEQTEIECETEYVEIAETETVVVEVLENEIVMLPTDNDIETEVIVETETEEYVSISFIPLDIQKLCFEIGYEYHIAPELLIAIIERESGGDINAVNKTTGCMGLMQLNPKYADYYLEKAGCSDPYKAEDNIRAGCEILLEKFEQYTDLPLVLMKYHGESNAVSKYKRGKYSNYCIGIIERMEEMQEITGG